MRKLVLLSLILPCLGHAASVVVVQGTNSAFGRRHFCGFTSSATEKISAFQYEAKKEDALAARIKKLTPDLVFTLGEVPLTKLIQQLPTTPFLVAGLHSTTAAAKGNVLMLENDLPMGAGLALAQSLFPTRKTVGTVYNPKQSADSFKTLVTLTGQMGLKIASLKVDSPSDIKSFINAFAGKVDILYWIRDSTTADPSSLDEVYKFAQKNNIPVISMDPGHVERGAVLSIASDPFAMGDQAWSIAQIVLKEGKIPQVESKLGPGQMIANLSLGTATKYGVDAEGLQKFLQGALKDGYNVKVLP